MEISKANGININKSDCETIFVDNVNELREVLV